MAAHRYWRLTWRGSIHGGVRDMATECEMRLTAGGADETGSGTPSASSVFGGSAANVFDNDTGTNLTMNDFTNGWVKYDFGASNDKAIVELTLRCNTANGAPATLKIEGSDDDSLWIPYHYAHGLSWTNGETKTFTFGPLHPRLSVSSLGKTSITIAGVYLHPAAAQESVQWELEEETGDFSTPLQDTGEITSDLTSHVFSGLDPETVYQIRCRMKEEDNSTWGNYGYLFIRTPQHNGGSREDFDPDDLGSAPTGWLGATTAHSVRDDDDHITDNARTNQDHSMGVRLRSHNNAVWSAGAYPLYWNSGPSIANVRVVALVESFQQTAEMVVGARFDIPGDDGYLVHLRSSAVVMRAPDGTVIDSGAGVANDVRHWVVLECDGDTIRCKYWAEGTAEPGSFTLSGTNSERLSDGLAWWDGDIVNSGSLPSVDHIQVEFLNAQVPETPVLALDDFSDVAAELSTNAFSGGSGVHKDSQWQVAIDAGFVTILHDVLSSTDKVAHIATGLPPGTALWARVRWRDDAFEFGPYSNVVNWTSTSNPGCGITPVVTVGGITDVAATLSTEPLPEYIETQFRILQGATLIQQFFNTGGDRFSHQFLALTPSASYTGQVRVRRTCGFSPWSLGIDFTMLAVPPSGTAVLGCPPVVEGAYWNPDSNPLGYDHWRGTGWFTPYAGQPLSGIVTCSLRTRLSGHSWDIEISDDLGVTYTPLLLALEDHDTDGDGLEAYTFMLDTTLLADGVDYRLKATDDADVVESLSFAVDNAGAMGFFSNRDFRPDDDRFGIMWCTKKTGGIYGNPAAEFPAGTKAWWQNSISRDIIALRGHPWSAYVDRDLPSSLGGDVTVRFYLWSGEGGFRGIQGGIDLEAWSAGIGFMINGISELSTNPPLADEQTGIFVGITYLAKGHPFGCCDDYYTMSGATLDAIGRSTQENTFAGLDLEDDSEVNSANIITIPKMYGNSWFNIPNFEDHGPFAGNFIRFRQGHLPGVNLEKKETCGRRYSVYSVRARVEVDPSNHGRVRIRTRADGPGIVPPGSGYWHYDKWHLVRASQGEGVYTAGALGLASKQAASTLWGDANGGRNFVSWSALPLNPGPPLTVPPEPLEPFSPPQEGAPCSLVLEAYEEDRETLVWEVGTDRQHLHPYLANPEHYGEQEVDIIKGGATIGQVDVIVIDKPQTVGDQDSGWLTQRLVEGGVGVIHGRRFRLRRFISFELGWVTIADGPAGSPRLDPSYAGYRWQIRDTRDTERKLPAFQTPSDFQLFPPGLLTQPWGLLPDETYLVPLVTFATGTVVHGGSPEFPEPNTSIVVDTSPLGIVLTQPIRDVAEFLITDREFTVAPGSNLGVVGEFHNLVFEWRLVGDDDTQWRTIVAPKYFGNITALLNPPPASLPAFFRTGPGDVTSEVGDVVDRIVFDIPVEIPFLPGFGPSVPPEGTIEYRVFAEAKTSEQFPFHVDEITTGQLLKNLYDGLYSPRDVITGDIVPTNIRYDPEALALMTDLVRMRLTEPVDDARAWAEKHVYAPTGWVPALDFDLRIAPKSQVPPDDFNSVIQVNDAVTEPVPNWNAGENIVNILQVEYPRWYAPVIPEGDPPINSIDGLISRDVLIEFRDEASITSHGNNKVKYDAVVFAALGDETGESVGLPEEELGFLLSEQRKLYVFDRYRHGAQLVNIPVRRSHVATVEAGDFIVVDLSWIPDYLLQRRGGVFGGQVLAVKDLDCAWRELLIEEVLPLIVS